MQIKQSDKIGSCGCGRSPTGQCCGWHALTEEHYLERLNLYIQEQADKDKDERTLD